MYPGEPRLLGSLNISPIKTGSLALTCSKNNRMKCKKDLCPGLSERDGFNQCAGHILLSVFFFFNMFFSFLSLSLKPSLKLAYTH